jgi:hypothetical protein
VSKSAFESYLITFLTAESVLHRTDTGTLCSVSVMTSAVNEKVSNIYSSRPLNILSINDFETALHRKLFLQTKWKLAPLSVYALMCPCDNFTFTYCIQVYVPSEYGTY